MLNSRSASQPGEYSATWKNTTQGLLTVLLNHTSETNVNCSNCSVTINCASQKGRHFSEKLVILVLAARFFVIQSIRRIHHSFTQELPHTQVHTSSMKALPSMKQLPDLVPLFASPGHQGLVLQSPNLSLSQKTEPGLRERQEHIRAHSKMGRFKGAGGEQT